MEILSRPAYERQLADTRDDRMNWWRDARFGMFVHYGLYSILQRHEWAQVMENFPRDEYAKLADQFYPAPGCCDAWAKQAKAAGCHYMVMTTRHHEGFSLWDSKANPFNSVNHGAKRDIVKEFVEACRKNDLKIGFYTSLMDWHHPDAWKAAFDGDARKRFLAYIEALNTELLTQYGKIDILWYDVARPMETWEGWDSLERNQRLRAIQPHLIINDRSYLPEDFGTPEGEIRPDSSRDWEACMTFNDLSWGYVDEEQVLPYAYTMPRILRMLNTCSANGGNLLLNIGPKADGSVPKDAVAPLTQTGDWLSRNGACVYGTNRNTLTDFFQRYGNGISSATVSNDRKHIYLWCWIWPSGGEMGIGGYRTAPNSITVLGDGMPVTFTHEGHRILLHNLPERSPDPSGITVLDMAFDTLPDFKVFSYYPQLCHGEDLSEGFARS